MQQRWQWKVADKDNDSGGNFGGKCRGGGRAAAAMTAFEQNRHAEVAEEGNEDRCMEAMEEDNK